MNRRQFLKQAVAATAIVAIAARMAPPLPKLEDSLVAAADLAEKFADVNVSGLMNGMIGNYRGCTFVAHGAQQSQHLRGRAFDIVVMDEITPYDIPMPKYGSEYAFARGRAFGKTTLSEQMLRYLVEEAKHNEIKALRYEYVVRPEEAKLLQRQGVKFHANPHCKPGEAFMVQDPIKAVGPVGGKSHLSDAVAYYKPLWRTDVA